MVLEKWDNMIEACLQEIIKFRYKTFFPFFIALSGTSALGMDSMDACFVMPFERIELLEVTFLLGVDDWCKFSKLDVSGFPSAENWVNVFSSFGCTIYRKI